MKKVYVMLGFFLMGVVFPVSPQSAYALTIGESYQGGIVAHILESGDPGYIADQTKGFIAAPSDQSAGAAWGCQGTAISGVDGTAIGTGNQNTIDIMAGCTTAGIAARLVGDLDLGGYSDWYLPSKDELNKVYVNRTAIGGFATSLYWTSSEIVPAAAMVHDFMGGSQGGSGKSSPNRVRAIRSFTAPNNPTLVSPSSGSTIGDDTPTLSAHYSDPDAGDTGTVKYRISSTSVSDCMNDSNIVASGSSDQTTSESQDTTWTPGSSIGSDITYYWCAQNDDGGLQSSWTSMGNFILDSTAPSAPGVLQATIGADFTSQDWSWTASTDTGSGMSYYHWQVDGGPSGTTSDTTVTTNLAVGNWKFHVKAEDTVGNQSTAQSALLSIFSSSLYQITIDNSVPVAWIITPDGVSDSNLDLSTISILNGDVFEANITTELHLKSILPSVTVSVDIPANIIIKAPSSAWSDKVFIPPVASTAPSLPAGFSASLVIKIGHDVASLDSTKGVRIFIDGQAGKRVGYISNDVFTEITATCAADSQTVGDALAAGRDCKVDVGSDLVIWTKHFSKFVTYEIVSSSTNNVSNENNSVNTNSASSSTSGCGNSITGGKPDLFEMRTSDTKVTIYFAPPPMPYNSFYIAYSRKPDVWEYGAEFKKEYSGGVMKETINLLQPNTTYYFKIRAGNGCAVGNWGNTMSATTTSFPGQTRTFYKNIFTAIGQKVIRTVLPKNQELSENSNLSSKSDVTTGTPTSAPTLESQTPTPTPAKNTFCFLWWCF